MKQKYTGILIAFALTISSWSLAANCPNGATSCYKKAIYIRDVGADKKTMQQRELNNKIYVPDHHDFGVHRVNNGSLTDVECIGFFADSFSDAVWGAAAYLALFGLNSSVGWVDATVKSSNTTRGPDKITDDIEELDYTLWVQALDELKGPKPGGYHLILFMCQSYAEELYN